MIPCSTVVFVLDCHIHIGRRPWPYVYFTLRDIWFSSADASYLLIPINGLLHVGLKPSIYGRAALLCTECTQPGDCLLQSHVQQMYVRAAAERSLSGTPMHLLLVDAPNVQFLWTKFFMQDWSLYALSFVRTLWTGYCELPDSAVALWTGYWVTHWELLWIKLNCVARSRAADNTTRVFEQWSIFNPAFAVRDATANVPTAPASPLLPTASATPYFLRSSDPSANFVARPSTKTLPLPARFWPSGALLSHTTLARSFLRETTVQPFLDDFNTVCPSGDSCHNLHIFSGFLFF